MTVRALVAAVALGACGVLAGSAGAASVGRTAPLPVWFHGDINVNAVVVSGEGSSWILRDEGETPLGVSRPCAPLADRHAARCPTGDDGWARLDLGSWDSVRKLPGTPGHLYVHVSGKRATVDVRDGQVDEVACGAPPTDVLADPHDRVWGSCDLLNGQPWQRDEWMAGEVRDADALDGDVVSTQDYGPIVVRGGAETRVLARFDEYRNIYGLTAGRDAAGQNIAVFRHSASIWTKHPRWLALSLAGGSRQTVQPSAHPGCTVDGVAIWEATVTTALACDHRTRTLVLRRVGDGATTVLLDRSYPKRHSRPIRITVRGDLAAVTGHGEIWVMRTGAAPCSGLIAGPVRGGRKNRVVQSVGRAAITGDEVVWPTLSGPMYAGMAADFDRWATRAQVGPDCHIVAGTARDMILHNWADAVLPVGDGVWLFRQASSLRRRPWQTVPPPLRPFADWLGSRTRRWDG